MDSKIEDIGKYYLYRHVRLDTSEVFYVGIGTKSSRPSYRASTLYYRAHSKPDRSAFWKKVTSKTDYEVEILLESDDYEFIKQKEIEFISLYGRRDLNKGTLVNLTDGGEGSLNVVCSDKTRKLISAASKGKKVSKETLKKIQIHKDIVKEETRKELIGKVFKTNQGCSAKVIEYISCKKVTVEFDEGNQLGNCLLSELRRGSITNPMYRGVCGIGYIGARKVTNKKAYSYWCGLISRNCTTSTIPQELHNFQNFIPWFEENYREGWILGYNVLETDEIKGNNYYFLPKELHAQFRESQGCNIKNTDNRISVNFLGKHIGYFSTTEEAISKYKEIKKSHILKVVKKYKSMLPEEVYEKIVNYEIQIKK